METLNLYAKRAETLYDMAHNAKASTVEALAQLHDLTEQYNALFKHLDTIERYAYNLMNDLMREEGGQG